jgi:thiol-disulfide isomerase/thioredoxin
MRLPRKHIVLRYIVTIAALTLVTGAAAAETKPRIAGRDVLSGKPLSLNALHGRPVFVNVWGSWCGGCNAEARLLARFSREHRRQVAFLGIDTMDSRTAARAFYDRYDTDYPSIFDPKGILAGAWSRGAPTTLVFNRRHVLVRRIEGASTLKQLNAALRVALSR